VQEKSKHECINGLCGLSATCVASGVRLVGRNIVTVGVENRNTKVIGNFIIWSFLVAEAAQTKQ
jgi:hypothetical protein